MLVSTLLAAESADLVLTGGKVVTLDGKLRIVEALAVRGGKIVAVGSNADVQPLIGPKTEVIRLDGKTALPGFIESHCHAVGVARGMLDQTYAELTSIAEMQDWIRQAARDVPAGRWIEVPRNEITRLKERRFPTPAEMDAACTTHPVLFNSVSNKWVLNTKGFETLGLLNPSSKLEDGEVVRVEAGKPQLLRGGTGTIRKHTPKNPEHSQDEVLAALAKVLRTYNQVGITSIFERATDPEYRGEQFFSLAEMQTVFATAEKLGWQMSCHVTGDEGKLGTLDVGKLADVVVLDRDYLMCREGDIAKLRVERTIVGGRTVFRN